MLFNMRLINRLQLFYTTWRMRRLFLRFHKMYVKSGNAKAASCAVDALNTYLREFSFQNIQRIENMRKVKNMADTINRESD